MDNGKGGGLVEGRGGGGSKSLGGGGKLEYVFSWSDVQAWINSSPVAAAVA